MTPATRSTGPRAPGGDARRSTGFIADPRPSQVTGGVGESRLGRRDPRDAQAGAAKRRVPARGNHNRNREWKESQSEADSKSPAKHSSRAARKEADGGAEAGGKEKEDGEGGGERRSSMRRRRKVNEKYK